MNEKRVLVTGLAGHRASSHERVKRRGYWVRAIGIKPPEFG
jgi:hypothetical protein